MGRPPSAGVRRGRRLTEKVQQGRELRNARLESLRAIGALSVLCAHALVTATLTLTPENNLQNRFLLAGGELIFLFFVLSGALLYTPFSLPALSSHQNWVNVAKRHQCSAFAPNGASQNRTTSIT